MAKKAAKKPKSPAASAGEKPKSPALTKAQILENFAALDLEFLQHKFNASPGVPSPAVAPPPAPQAKMMEGAAAEGALPMAKEMAPLAEAPTPAEVMAEALAGGAPPNADAQFWRRLVRLCLLSLEKKKALFSPAGQGLALSNPADLETYVISQEFRFRLLDLHDAAFAALADAGHAMAANHALAAATIVDTVAPGDPGAASMLADLRALSDEIRGDQNFSTVLNLLEAAAAAYAGTPVPA